MTPSSDVWLQIATQIPVVLLFCIFMGYIVKMFLGHINSQEDRSRDFIKEQRKANNETVLSVAQVHSEAVKDLASSTAITVKDLASTNAAAVKDLASTNAAALKDLSLQHKEDMTQLTTGIRDDLTGIAACLSNMNAAEVGHDAFVRTAFVERFGAATMSNAEAAAKVAEAQAKK
jgi:hypothetical protein